MLDFATISSKSEEKQNLLLSQFPEQQLKAGNSENYYQALTNFDFVFLKINHPKFGVEPLIRDYSLIYDPEILEKLEANEKLEPEKVKTLKLIQRALQLSAHVLNQDPNQLVGQLWGRLQSFQQPEIQKILADAAQSKSEIPRFRPITASLTTPGGNLLRTLTGHNSRVNAVAIAPDGKKAVSGSADETLKVWDLQTGTVIHTLKVHKLVNAVAIAPDGKTAVSDSDYGSLKVWDLQTGKEISALTHDDWLEAVAIAPDGQTAVFVSFVSDRKALKAWNPQTGKEISTLRGHDDWLEVAITPDGNTAIFVSDRKNLKVWDLQRGEEISTLRGHKSRVTAVAITPDGKTAVSGSHDNTLKAWDLETGKQISTLIGHKQPVLAVAIAPDGKKAVSGSADDTLKVWDLQTGREISTLIGHNNWVNAVAIAPNGKTAVSASDDNTLKVWDLETGTKISALPPLRNATQTECNANSGHNEWVTAVAMPAAGRANAPDGKTAVSASDDNTLKVWDLETGKEISTPDVQRIPSSSIDSTLKSHGLQEFSTLTNLVNRIAITPDAKTALFCFDDHILKIWDCHTEILTQKIKQRLIILIIFIFILLPSIILPAVENLPLLRNIKIEGFYLKFRAKLFSTLTGHKGSVNAVAITPDNQKAVSASDDKTLKLWDLETGKAIFTLRGHTGPVNAVAIAQDGKKAVSGSDDKTLKLWDLETGKEISTFINDSPILCCAVSPNGFIIVAGEQSGRVHFLRLEGG